MNGEPEAPRRDPIWTLRLLGLADQRARVSRQMGRRSFPRAVT